MLGGLRMPQASMRNQLSFAALAILGITIAITVMLLLTAWNTAGVLEEGRQAQERVRIYTQLQDAARGYQAASYQAVREPSEDSDKNLLQQRVRLLNLLNQAERLPARTEQEEDIQERIVAQGQTVVDHYRDAAVFVQAVDAVWNEQGSQAAMQAVQEFTLPILALRDTLNAEIRRSDANLAAVSWASERLIERSVLGATIGLAAAIALAGLMQFLLHARMRPALQKLEQGAEAVRRGELDHRIELGGRDELAQLAGAFDAMAGDIADKQRGLMQAKQGLELAVSERTAELEEANAKLAASDKRRRAFLADISHELRTPLTVIRGEAQVAMRSSCEGDVELQGTFDRILAQTDLLRRMVNDLFLIARAEAGGLRLERQVLNLREIAGGVAADFEKLAEESGGRISLADGGDVWANVDADRVQRALLALTENALVHCQPGVAIDIEVAREDGFAWISVSDNGPGVDFSQADQLFDRFRRGETDAEGSGLGLSLVSALAAAHGGLATLSPSAAGGTCASISFPCADIDREVA